MENIITELEAKNQKSFYGKALLKREVDGSITLFSYYTPIINKKPNGDLIRYWDGWSNTTGRHIKDFCGLNKKEYFKIPITNYSVDFI